VIEDVKERRSVMLTSTNSRYSCLSVPAVVAVVVPVVPVMLGAPAPPVAVAAEGLLLPNLLPPVRAGTADVTCRVLKAERDASGRLRFCRCAGRGGDCEGVDAA
jgi:hypothetical protein